MAKTKKSSTPIEDTLQLLSKTFGKGFAESGLADTVSRAIPTGHDDLDMYLTRGSHGLYLGGIIELIGSEASGKTSLALRLCGNAQKLGHRCCWIDAEAAFEPDLAKLNGVNLKPEWFTIPNILNTKAVKSSSNDDGAAFSFWNAGQLLHMVYKVVETNGYGVVVLDSLAGLVPERLYGPDFDPDSKGMAELARALSEHLRKLAPICRETETMVIFVNQLRDKLDGMSSSGGRSYHSPGGRSLKHFCHQRISVEKKWGSKGEVWSTRSDGMKELIGHYATVKILKNRKAPPVPKDMILEVPIYYREYFPDDTKLTYDKARQMQVVTQRLGTICWKGENNKTILTTEKDEGEADFLDKLRTSNLAPRLAQACVNAESSDRNQNLKNPVAVGSSIKKIAEKWSEVMPEPKKTASKKSPAKPGPDIKLDDEGGNKAK